MRYKVYDSKEEEKCVLFRLVESKEGDIMLKIVDEKGFCVRNGNILSLYKSGRIIRNEGVDNSLGLDLDERSRIKID